MFLRYSIPPTRLLRPLPASGYNESSWKSAMLDGGGSCGALIAAWGAGIA